MNIINIDKQVQQSIKDLPNEDYMLGRMLLQPFKPANSGSRALMSAIHAEQFMVLNNGEIPIIQTGYETEFGRNSTSYVVAEHTYKVIAKVYKFSFTKEHYYLILENLDTGEYDVVERLTYKHITERYGYLWDNRRIDLLNVNDIINPEDIIKTSNGFDEYGNKKNGTNLLTLYLASVQNMEDSVILSESAALKLETSLIKTTSITINDNDILLNLFGRDQNEYKTFPDVGEYTTNGIFCALRRIENKDVLYSLANAYQKKLLLSDKPILINGTVADIDVYCNNPDRIGKFIYNTQLNRYYQEKLNFCKQINDIVGPLAMKYKLSYQLAKLYAICRDTIAGREYYKDKLFDNIILEVTVVEKLPMNIGDKLADRYGGKGVVSEIKADELMPLLDDGRRVEVIKNQSTCIRRLNIGQLHEQSLSMIGLRIIDVIKKLTASGEMTYTEAFDLWYRFVNMVDQEQANYALTYIDVNNEEMCRIFIESVLNDDGIIISTPPFTTPINIDSIKSIYDEFPWIRPFNVMMPIKDSNGDIRYVPCRRSLAAGKIYNYRLKQYAEEHFSATSLSTVNLKGLNTRSKANKVYETRYTKTPIQFGFMETADLLHIGMQYVITNLMLYNNSTRGRRLFEELLTGSPYDINIKLDMDSTNRNAEIINVMLKTMGLRLRFIKRPKIKRDMVKNILYKTIPGKEWNIHNPLLELIGIDSAFPERLATAQQHKGTTDIVKNLLTVPVDNNGDRIYETNIVKVIEDYNKSLENSGLEAIVEPIKS